MAAHPEIDEALSHLRTVSERMTGVLEPLPVSGWDGPTNCPPWTVRDLAVHVVSTGDSFLLSVERGVAGSIEGGPVQARHKSREAALVTAAPDELVRGLAVVTASTERLYERLSASQLEASCYHRCRAGTNGSARWNLVHRLVEVAYHGWDLERSLGRDAAIPEATAAFLLATLLEDHLPTIYEKEPRSGWRVCFVASSGDGAARAGSAWTLDAGPDRLAVTRGRGEADVTITAPPSVLALLIYGRADLLEEARQGRAAIEGEGAFAERFDTLMPAP